MHVPGNKTCVKIKLKPNQSRLQVNKIFSPLDLVIGLVIAFHGHRIHISTHLSRNPKTLCSPDHCGTSVLVVHALDRLSTVTTTTTAIRWIVDV